MFSIGMIIMILPFIIWLIHGNAIKEFWDAYIVFNFSYSSSTLSDKFGAIVKFSNTICYISSLVILINEIRADKNNRVFNITYLLYVLSTMYLVAMSGRKNNHYGMILVPMFAYPLALLMSNIDTVHPSRHGLSPVALITVLCSVYFLILPSWNDLITDLPQTYENRNENRKIRNKDVDCDELRKVVNEYTDPDDLISVYGNWDFVYVYCHRRHATRYSYQLPIGTIRPAIMDDYFKQLQDEPPKLIVLQPNHADDERINTFLNANKYHSVMKNDDGKSIVYIHDMN